MRTSLTRRLSDRLVNLALAQFVLHQRFAFFRKRDTILRQQIAVMRGGQHRAGDIDDMYALRSSYTEQCQVVQRMQITQTLGVTT